MRINSFNRSKEIRFSHLDKDLLLLDTKPSLSCRTSPNYTIYLNTTISRQYTINLPQCSTISLQYNISSNINHLNNYRLIRL